MKKEESRWLLAGVEALCIIAAIFLILQIEEKIYYLQIESGNYEEELRQLELTEEIITYLQEMRKEQEKEQEDWLECLTAAMIEKRFLLEDADSLDNRGKKEFDREQRLFEKLEKQYREIFNDLEYFPVGEDTSGKESFFYENSWHGIRTYGGERVHEGTDIMTSNNVRGYFPVYSMTDGVVEKMGWLQLGGWRIGIRAPSGGYFYYAHLSDYAEGLQEGDELVAGQLIGHVGDSGYSQVEGTVGNFDVHLHVGIYIDNGQQEISVNPYWVLRFLENRKISF